MFKGRTLHKMAVCPIKFTRNCQMLFLPANMFCTVINELRIRPDQNVKTTYVLPTATIQRNITILFFPKFIQ